MKDEEEKREKGKGKRGEWWSELRLSRFFV